MYVVTTHLLVLEEKLSMQEPSVQEFRYDVLVLFSQKVVVVISIFVYLYPNTSVSPLANYQVDLK